MTRPVIQPRRGGYLTVPLTVEAAEPPAVLPGLSRQITQGLIVTRRGQFLTAPLVGAVPPETTGFLCQDLATTATVDSYAGVAVPVAYSTTAALDTHAATVIVDTDSATAVICGR